MALATNGAWRPDLYPKQHELLAICREPNGLQKIVLVNGPKFSSKTTGCANAICDHCWNTEFASVSVVVPTQTAGEDGGFWEFLTEKVIPEWIAGEFGFEWAVKGKPRQKGTTKKMVCAVTNKYGGTSKIMLNSIREEREVEKNFFNRSFTMIYVSEAALVMKKKESYTALLSCFRGKDIPDEKFLFLLDTNPADNGDDNHLYKTFYVLRTAAPETLTPDERTEQKFLRLHEIFLDDNLGFSEEKKAQIRAMYASDPDLWARYGLGQWKKASKGALFAAYFQPAKHVIGNEDGIEQILVPQDDCSELMTGWDWGPVNPFVCFCEKFYHTFPIVGKPDEFEELPCFKFLDEIGFLNLTVDDDMTLADFTHLVCEKRDYWMNMVGKPVPWIHYSDRSAFNARESSTNIFQHHEVYAASNGTISLVAVDKPGGSVSQSIRLWRKLLLQGRILFSESKCPRLIEMNQNIMPGKQGQPIDKGSIYKHAYDAAKYILMPECFDEIQQNILVLQNAGRTSSKVISIPL